MSTPISETITSATRSPTPGMVCNNFTASETKGSALSATSRAICSLTRPGAEVGRHAEGQRPDDGRAGGETLWEEARAVFTRLGMWRELERMPPPA